MKRREFLSTTAALGLGALAAGPSRASEKRVNILWIVAEDVSAHLGCYGERAVHTPHLDQLAREGVLFNNAFVSCPVCSPARSALVTGLYQTTIGSLHHRSQREDPRGGANKAYYDSYKLPDSIPLVGDMFRAAGYYVCNGADVAADRQGKTDYNFLTDHEAYDGSSWQDAPGGMPFFAQIQLPGAKSRKPASRIETFSLPPYYPDDAVIRRDWAQYLDSCERMDDEVGRIISQLKDAGVYENTVVVFLSDHGVSHARGKQFLYEEGIRVPMIIRFPDGRQAGTVREDLALHIDLVPTALAWAGVAAAEHLQGRDLFAETYEERPFVVCARDRCDETVDTIRCVRTAQYKYIRNFQSFRSHMQFNRYKERKDIIKRLRQLHAEEKLTPAQARIFAERRPAEELYDLNADPFEMHNLAGDPAHDGTLRQLRDALYVWMDETHDAGLLPEPMLEELGRIHGSKYAAMQRASAEQTPALIRTIEAGERGDAATLYEALKSGGPGQRYWAATWLGLIGDSSAVPHLENAEQDEYASVRIAIHLACCTLGYTDRHLLALSDLVEAPNCIVGMYAMNAIEQTQLKNDVVREAARKALASPYDPTQRYGQRLAAWVDGRPWPL